jgi:hypothetical protein
VPTAIPLATTDRGSAIIKFNSRYDLAVVSTNLM